MKTSNISGRRRFPKRSRRPPTPGSAYLAAGTNLLDLMKGGVARPDRLVDVTRLPGPRSHRTPVRRRRSASVRSCATPTSRTIPISPARYPAIAEALLSGASAQLRNAATVGGNLLQRTRCGYFYDVASACNKREPGSGCDARHGENRLHAVLGWSEACIATHPSDFCVPLVALDAVVEIEGRSGRREVALENLHRLPGDDAGAGKRAGARRPHRRASACPPRRPRFRAACTLSEASRAHLLRFRGRIRRRRARHRRGQDHGRPGLRSAASRAKPWRARAAEEILAGAAPTSRAFRRAAEAALADAKTVRRQRLQDRTCASGSSRAR